MDKKVFWGHTETSSETFTALGSAENGSSTLSLCVCLRWESPGRTQGNCQIHRQPRRRPEEESNTEDGNKEENGIRNWFYWAENVFKLHGNVGSCRIHRAGV